MSIFFFFNDTATTEIYTLSLHDALPIFPPDGTLRARGDRADPGRRLPRRGLPGRRRPRRGAAVGPRPRRGARRGDDDQIGRAHVRTPVTPISRMPSSA